MDDLFNDYETQMKLKELERNFIDPRYERAYEWFKRPVTDYAAVQMEKKNNGNEL